MNPTPGKTRTLTVAGIMSGTSADGVDVAFCRISLHKDGMPRLKLLGHRSFAYDATLRKAVLAAMDAQATTTAEIARLHWRLGEVYAECVEATALELAIVPDLIACHGQTIYHQGTETIYLGHPLRCTLQIGEAAIIAERLGITTISDFRPADMAANGQAAPLVPMLDLCLFRHATKNRLLLNLGGIANITALPAACNIDAVLAFDTGPANMIVDACMKHLYNKRFDADGATAARGRILRDIITPLLQAPYYTAPPPKSCGREQYGEAFVTRFITTCEQAGARKQDIIATATAFTAETILDAYRRFCWPHLGQQAPLARATELFAAGGGANNATLMRHLTEGFAALGIKVATTDAAGLPTEAKEAAAFALLGWLTWHGLPGNVPSATGASRPMILGKVSLA